MSGRRALAAALAAGLAAPASPALAESHSGVDAVLFRPSIDTAGVFSLEGARPMPARDLSWKMLAGYAQRPFEAAVPGIGADDADVVLDYVATIDLAFGLALTSRLTIGFDAALYRTSTGEGYGERGRYSPEGSQPSTGLISLRPLSNLDPSGGYEPQGLAGPLDARLVAKYAVWTSPRTALAVVGAASMPFGEDEMFLGDTGLVLEPRVALDHRFGGGASRVVVNLGLRLRERTVLEAYDADAGQDEAMALVVSDVGSEVVAGAGVHYELGPRAALGAEVVGFVPVAGVALGDCRRHDGSPCSGLDDEDYFGDAKAGDLAAYVNLGVSYQVNPHVAATAIGGAGLMGQRADDFRAVVGFAWSPQDQAGAALGRGDLDTDGVPDVADACLEDAEDVDGYLDDDGCPDVDNDGDGVVDADDACVDEPEDKDGFADDDGCPERDNDGDGITDVADRCPERGEDVDGFEDDDGCPDDDNDGDGFADADDKCPNEPESVNGVEDGDGCPDARPTTGPEDLPDRIGLRGSRIEFADGSATLTSASKTLLEQVAQLLAGRDLAVRIEVHVPRSSTSSRKAEQDRARRRDKELAQRRADAVLAFLRDGGVPEAALQAVGIGSDRPLSGTQPADPANARVDFIKTQQRNP